MPSDKTSDRQDLARQLHSDDAPRSPRELDERIMQHARQKAEQYAEYSGSVGFKWLGDGWKTAVAVSSVAIVAISVTIQIYDNSRTTPFVASRAVPDAEVANVGSSQDLLAGLSDSAVQQRVLQESQITNDPTVTSDSQAGTPAPARSSDVTAEVTFRATERQLQLQAQPESLSLQSSAAEPSLVELLAEIDTLQGITPADQNVVPDNSLGRLRIVFDQLRVVLDLVETVLIDSSIETDVVEVPESAPTIEQLTAKADALVDAYTTIENSQLVEQLETAYQSRRETSSGTELPLNLAITIDVLENWLSDR